MGLFTWLYRKQRNNKIALPETLLKQQDFDANTPYMLPSHLQEVSRLDFQHYMLRYAFKANYLAPIEQPTSILDVACGTGRWMLEMAQAFPLARISGIDIIPPDTKNNAVQFPINCQFLQGNVLERLPFRDQSFDFVHQRFLVLALPLKAWPAEIKELTRITHIGGWIELVEADLEFNNQGPNGVRMFNWIRQASEKRGIDITIGRKTKSFLQAAGLANVTEHKIAIPMGNWGGRIGMMLATDLSTALVSIKPLVMTSLKVRSEDYDQTLERWQQECEKNHSTYEFTIVDGQRLI